MNITKAKFNNISSIAKENEAICGLIFGQNSGLALELSNEIFSHFTYDLKEIMTEEEILQDNNILFSSVAVDDFFAERKLIKIYNVTAKFYDVFQEIYPILQKKKDLIKICLIGDEIQAKVKLRTLFEESDNLISACCYFDEKDDAKSYIIKYFSENNIKYNSSLADFLAQNLYGDRRVVKNELEKIKLSFLQEKEKVITIDDIKDIIENQTLDNVFDFIDLFGARNKEKSIFILNKILQAEEISVIGLLHLLYRHFQNLLEICYRIESKKSNIEKELFAFFFKRKILVKKQIETWKVAEIINMINFITSLENASMLFGESFAKQLLINKIARG